MHAPLPVLASQAQVLTKGFFFSDRTPGVTKNLYRLRGREDTQRGHPAFGSWPVSEGPG